jgi:tetratricopeptide (TPR) repeat protein
MIARLVDKDGTGSAPAAAAGADRDLVLEVQRQLTRIGLDPGPLDGQIGARTIEAIEVYQDARGLPVDGRPSRGLLDRLAREPNRLRDTDQTSRIATNGAVAELLGATGSGKFPVAAPAPAPAPASAQRILGLDGYVAFRKAFAAAEVGDFGRAIDFYNRAIEAGDLVLADLADAYYNRANVRSHTLAYDFAIADYGAAIVNKPEFPGAYYNRGFAFEASGRHTLAVADFMKARALGLQRLGVRSPDQLPPKR